MTTSAAELRDFTVLYHPCISCPALPSTSHTAIAAWVCRLACWSSLSGCDLDMPLGGIVSGSSLIGVAIACGGNVLISLAL